MEEAVGRAARRDADTSIVVGHLSTTTAALLSLARVSLAYPDHQYGTLTLRPGRVSAMVIEPRPLRVVLWSGVDIDLPTRIERIERIERADYLSPLS